MATDAELAIVLKARDETRAALDSVRRNVGGLRGFMATAGGVAGGVLGANILTGLVRSGIDQITSIVGEAFEAEKLNAQTEAVLESTRSIAGISFENVRDLADNMQGLTTFTDDAVQDAANLLLTFTNIRGTETFDAATASVLDMATAMKIDASTAAVQIGKALNDPIRGVTALRRVGVQLSVDQEAAIKDLVDQGKLQEAQQIILNELQTEFGGSAEAAADTAAGGWQRMMNLIDEVKETIGMALLPTIQRTTKAFSEFLVEHQADIEHVADLIGTGLADAFEAVSRWFDAHQAEIENGLRTVAEVSRDLKAAWEEIEPVVARLFAIWQNEIETKLKVIRDIIVFVMAIIHGDWGRAWQALRQLGNDIFEGIKNDILLKMELLWFLIRTPVTNIKDFIVNAFGSLRDFLANNWREIVAVALAILFAPGAGLWALATNAFGVRDRIVDAFAAIPGLLRGLAGDFFGAAFELGAKLLDGLKGALTGAGGFASDVGQAVLRAVKAVVNSVIRSINSALEFSFDTHIPGVGKITVDPPDIPELHTGGRVLQSGLARVQKGEQWIASGAPGGAGGIVLEFAPGAVVLNRSSTRADAREFVDLIEDELRDRRLRGR